MRPRTSPDKILFYLRHMKSTEDDRNTFGDKIFGAIIGVTIFFGVGLALAHAGSLVV